jgi:hypothetical protein
MKSPKLSTNVAKFDLAFSRFYANNLGLLTPLWLLIVALCLSIPITQFPINPVVTDTLAGFKSSAPIWSVLLWLTGLPLAWAALLIGSALSNRLAFSVTAISATFFLSVCVITLPRDYFNSLVGVTVLLALGFCERNFKLKEEPRQPKEKTRLAMPLLNSVLVGAAAGTQIVILTPLKTIISTSSKLPGPLLGIGGGALLGIVLGLLTLWWARLSRNEKRSFFLRGSFLSVRPALWTTFALLAMFLLAGFTRAGLVPSGGLSLSSLVMVNSYLWPVLYLAGIVFLHSIFGTTGKLAVASKCFVPKATSAPLIVLFVLTGIVICFSETIINYLLNHSNTFTNSLLPLFSNVYLRVKPYVWNNPLNVNTVRWLSWVFGFDVVAIIALALQNRLTSISLNRLFFITIFAALLVSEYVLQTSSFSRGPADAVVVLSLLMLWLLWFMHKVSVSMKPESSQTWTSKGKVAIWCGIFALIALHIFGRAACKDFRVLNELFSTMFHGALALGLPYCFLVGLSKKSEGPLIKVSSVVGLFAAGLVTALTLNMLEKLASANWLVSGMMKIVSQQIKLLQTSGTVNFDVIIPTSWSVARSVIFVVILLALIFASREFFYGKRHSSTSTLLVLLTFASGVAAFSRTLVELPLPLEVRALTAPLVQDLFFNCNVLQSYLSCLVPALILGIAQFSDKKSAIIAYPMTIALAIWASYSVALMYTHDIVFLRATGLVYPVATMSCGVIAILATAAYQIAKRQIAKELSAGTKAPGPAPGPATAMTMTSDLVPAAPSKSDRSPAAPAVITPLALVISMLLLEACTLPIIMKDSAVRFEDKPIPAFLHKLTLKTDWLLQEPEPGKSPFTQTTLKKHNVDGDTSTLQLAKVMSNPQGTRILLRTLLTSAIKSNRFPGFMLTSAETWNKYAPEALACQFNYESKESVATMAGFVVLVPLADGKTECYTLFGPRNEVEQDKWELAYAISKLSDLLRR